MNAWVRSQPKTLRPYFGAEAAAELLAQTELVPGVGDEPLRDERLIVDDARMAAMTPTLHLHLDEAQLDAALGERRSAFELVVSLRTHQMFRRELVARYSLAHTAPETIEIPPALLHDAKRSGLFEVGVAICLAGDRPPEPGWPTQVGAWVARRRFVIGLDRTQSAFRILPLKQDMIDRWKLPQGTFLHVVIDRDLNAVLDEGDTCATAYVAERLLGKASAGKPALAALIESELICAVLTAPDNGLDSADTVMPGSPLAAILTGLREGAPLTLAELKHLIAEPARLRATVHHGSDLVRELEKL